MGTRVSTRSTEAATASSRVRKVAQRRHEMANHPATSVASKSDLLAACVARERAATIARLVRVLPRSDAEDAFQEACVRALAQLDRQREPHQLRPWFQTILRSVVAARLRCPERTSALEDHNEPPAPSAGGQCCGCGAGVLRRVRASHRSALERVLLYGEDVAEAARADGITPGHLRVRLYRGKRELANAWLRCCGACITEEGGRDCHCHERRDARMP